MGILTVQLEEALKDPVTYYVMLTEILAPENFLRNRCVVCVDGRSPDFST